MLETSIPARLDRLPWSAWHWRVVIALGLFAAYALAGVLMCAAAVAAWIGVDAERRSLEQVCPPLGCDLPA